MAKEKLFKTADEIIEGYGLKSVKDSNGKRKVYLKGRVRIPVDTRSPIPVISVQSVGDLQYRWQS